MQVFGPEETDAAESDLMAFVSDRSGNKDIYAVKPDGSSLSRLTVASETDLWGALSWSPYGTRIAYHPEQDGNWEIYVMDADGSNPTRLTSNQAKDRMSAWCPEPGRPEWSRDGAGVPMRRRRQRRHLSRNRASDADVSQD